MLEFIVNIFCEPLCDYKAVSSWNEIAQISIRAIEENWDTNLLVNILHEGLPNNY